MASALPSSAYVVLGLLATKGPSTPYELKRWVAGSVGHFWSFPRAQLYVEPQRLAALGLVSESRESEGRRKRQIAITERGLAVVREWIRSGATPPAELRDPGLLKLFFAELIEPADVVALAQEQAAEHRRRLLNYEQILPHLESDAGAAFALATLQLGLRHEQMAIDYWVQIAASPPHKPQSRKRSGPAGAAKRI